MLVKNNDGPTREIDGYVAASEFPCVGAKSALRRSQITTKQYGDIQNAAYGDRMLSDLYAFIRSYREGRAMFKSFVAEFAEPYPATEMEFETAMWARLQQMHDLDRKGFSWDGRVDSDPEKTGFSYSLGGEAFFIIGMHPQASRRSRRYPRPALVFNLHDQFERLRADGRYDRMRDVIRERDTAYCGSPNPVLRTFGEQSEARQYAGRDVPQNWRCPFHSKAE